MWRSAISGFAPKGNGATQNQLLFNYTDRMKTKLSNRRTFLKTSIGASAGALLLPQLSLAKSIHKPKEKDLVGHGDFMYSVNKSWALQDPSKTPVNDCHEMVLDKKGRIFMTTTGRNNNNIIIYDRSGKVLDSWGKNINGAHGLTLSSEGTDEFLFITDPDAGKVLKTDLKGNLMLTIETPREIEQYNSENRFKPTETAVAPNGDIYVADGYGQNYIIQYTSQGDYIRHFGGSGTDKENFDCCHGITLDTRNSDKPTLLITSRAKQEFKRFDLEGKHIETIALPGCSICRPVLHGSNLFFAVIITKSWFSYDGMLAVLDENNKVVSLPGGSAPKYENGLLVPPEHDGKTFLNPHDVLVDNDDNLYVPQWYSGKTFPVQLTRV